LDVVVVCVVCVLVILAFAAGARARARARTRAVFNVAVKLHALVEIGGRPALGRFAAVGLEQHELPATKHRDLNQRMEDCSQAEYEARTWKLRRFSQKRWTVTLVGILHERRAARNGWESSSAHHSRTILMTQPNARQFTQSFCLCFRSSLSNS
jgi:hypothetical protein